MRQGSIVADKNSVCVCEECGQAVKKVYRFRGLNFSHLICYECIKTINQQTWEIIQEEESRKEV